MTALTVLPWHAEAEQMWNDGVTAVRIANTFSVTKNVIVGIAFRRGWSKHAGHTGGHPPPSTLHTRLDAIDAKLDGVIEGIEPQQGESLCSGISR